MTSMVYALLALTAVLGLAHLAGQRLPYVAVVVIYVVIYAVIDLGLRRRRVEKQVIGEKWPTSGPIGRFGQRGLIFAFAVSGLLALLNPFQLSQIVRQALGDRRAARRKQVTTGTRTVYSLPCAGTWLVYSGGTTETTSHSWAVVAQRYAYDLVVADGEKRRHSGSGTKLTDYRAYGEPILAAADGTVVAAEGSMRDAPLVGYGVVDFLSRSFFGNHVVVKHDEGEFGLYAHLAPGSVKVAVGESVARGQLLGDCGHSGHSSEPHLHFHVQDRPGLFDGRGLVIRFGEVVVNGEPRSQTTLQVGDEVCNPSTGDRMPRDGAVDDHG